ncbi:hypothetical protein AV530_019375 [Patagioenas fasciata monilis]|uniref:Uncharacterized protein n=1 Tax=Patagioenas fasciata monilis TaxID=372326 RepID=A0A1V4JDF3_PATFA|nr:hypothetical protein AV530_019375 [Patagioenas fasciata monilis]
MPTATAESFPPHHGHQSACCEERALPRAVIGCSTAFWNLPEQANQEGTWPECSYVILLHLRKLFIKTEKVNNNAELVEDGKRGRK